MNVLTSLLFDTSSIATKTFLLCLLRIVNIFSKRFSTSKTGFFPVKVKVKPWKEKGEDPRYTCKFLGDLLYLFKAKDKCHSDDQPEN